MAKAKFPKLYKRKWLNKGKGSAYIIIDAEVEPHWNDTEYPDDRTINADVELKDCTRQINLEFYCHDMEGYKQRLTKIRKLIEALEEVEQFLKDNPPHRTPRKKGKKEKTYLESLSKEDDILDLTEDMKVSETPAIDPDKVVQVSAVVRPVIRSNETK